jgi:hypothetical protein
MQTIKPNIKLFHFHIFKLPHFQIKLLFTAKVFRDMYFPHK